MGTEGIEATVGLKPSQARAPLPEGGFKPIQSFLVPASLDVKQRERDGAERRLPGLGLEHRIPVAAESPGSGGCLALVEFGRRDTERGIGFKEGGNRLVLPAHSLIDVGQAAVSLPGDVGTQAQELVEGRQRFVVPSRVPEEVDPLGVQTR
jgi:hypothetical protein